jgi:hypothetical protein
MVMIPILHGVLKICLRIIMTKNTWLVLLLLVGCGGDDGSQNTTTQNTTTTPECIASDELCNGVDDDCDGLIDESDAVDGNSFYEDVDADGFGNPDSTILSCNDTMDGYVVGENTDCDDTVSDIHPGADEYCDGVDTDCSGTVDDDYALDTLTWYADADNDGYGNPDESWNTCDAPAGWVADNADCNDASNNSYPGATEFCDEEDNNCDGSTDEGVQTTYYIDEDSDGYGNSDETTLACSTPTGYASISDDCDDTDAYTHPSAFEYCNGIDNDCDGAEVSSGVGLTLDGGTSWSDESSYFSTTNGIQSGGFSDEGDLFFCGDTTYYVNWEINDDLTVTGVNGKPTLNGGWVDRVITVNNNTVSFTNIGIANGSSDSHGGGISQAGGTLNLVDVDFIANIAQINGGGLHLSAGAVMFGDNLYFYNNAADNNGGGIYVTGEFVSGGDVEIYNSYFYYNRAEANGGAIRGYEVDNITLVDSYIFYNYADWNYDYLGGGGAIALVDSNLTAKNSGKGLYSCAFEANWSSQYGAVLLDRSTADFTDCNFGYDTSVFDNTVHDITTYGSGFSYEYYDVASLTCDEYSCGSVISENTGKDFSDFVQSFVYGDWAIGHVIQSTDTRTIDSFELYTATNTPCNPTYYIYASSNGTDWIEKWSGIGDLTASKGLHSSGNIGIPTEENIFYALFAYFDVDVCGDVEFWYSDYSQPTNISFGTFESYIVQGWMPGEELQPFDSYYTFWGNVHSSH